MLEPSEAGRTAFAHGLARRDVRLDGAREEPTRTERRGPLPAAHLMDRPADSPAGRPGRPSRPR